MSTKMINIASHAEVMVRRPDGTVETVRWTGGVELTDGLFARAKAATTAAGRGELLSYTNVRKDVPQPAEWAALEAAEKAEDARYNDVLRAMDHYAEGGR